MTMQLHSPGAARGDVAFGEGRAIDCALRALGNRTALLLVCEAFYGATRFDQFRKRAGVTGAVVAQRLRELVLVGVLEKQPYREPGQRTRHEYILTTAGRDLMPVILGLLQWGAAHPPVAGDAAMTHDGCGAQVRAVVRCAAGHDVNQSDVVVAVGGSSSE
jgi:DNA-binding HxlR family transcriptional regulator